ncbi:hypothetical protein C5167_020025 [Papaver somniferum]|uniref:Uncharacterized protein n=1 Tax=Papaver somniferum TaxID=3469 RepID=A0A4Y7IVS4_PAPSO|nr:hypothetical protein C5167_020025 [Papaver somniferum]
MTRYWDLSESSSATHVHIRKGHDRTTGYIHAEFHTLRSPPAKSLYWLVKLCFSETNRRNKMLCVPKKFLMHLRASLLIVIPLDWKDNQKEATPVQKLQLLTEAAFINFRVPQNFDSGDYLILEVPRQLQTEGFGVTTWITSACEPGTTKVLTRRWMRNV